MGNNAKAISNSMEWEFKLNHLQQLLKESEEKFESLYASNHIVMLLIDSVTGEVVDANQAACKFYGYSKKEITSKNITEINTFDKRQIFLEMTRAKNEQRMHFYFNHRLANGEIRNVEVYSGPIKVWGRELLYSIVLDITEKRKAEAFLRESEEGYRQLFQLSPDVIIIHNDGKIISANNKAVNVLGVRDVCELIDQDIETFIHPRYRLLAKENFNSFQKQKSTDFVEYKFLKNDGTVFIGEATSAPLKYQGNTAIQTVVRDITERKKEIEKAAKIQRQRLSTKFPLEDKGELEVVYVPAKLISGDLFHFYKVDDNHVVGFLGDVSGKGISAALSNSALKVLFYEAASKTKEPLEVLNILNKEVGKYLQEEYIAAICFAFDFLKQKIKIAGAGINTFSYSHKGFYCVEEIIRGPFLGMLENNLFDETIMSFTKGDKFYFYTDGLEELINSGQFIKRVNQLPTIKMQKELVKRNLSDNGNLQDDVTWLAIEII